MSTLRDRVREALSATDPTEREANADLDAVLGRSRRRRKTAYRWSFIAPALAVAVAAVYFGISRHDVPLTVGHPSAQTHHRGVHLYLRVFGEPEDHAIALDLESKGEP